MSFGTVILGAGASSRMGAPKLLLPWGDESILQYLARVWISLGCEQLGVVCGPPPHPIWTELEERPIPGVERILNPRPEEGMFSSILAAARWPGWRKKVEFVVLTLGDQPHVRPGTLTALLANPRPIVQPRFEGRPKHPIKFGRGPFLDLAHCHHTTLREFLAGRPDRAYVDVVDPGLALDIDTPADYQTALAARDAN